MLTTTINAVFALIAVCAAVYAWIESYDTDLRLDKIERGYGSMNSRLGKIKQDAIKAAKEEARDVAQDAAAAQSGGGGGGGLDMEALLPMMMGSMSGGGGDGAPRNTPQEEPEQNDPMVLGQGGTE